MSYSTLMVHLNLGSPNMSLLQTAGDLAERYQSRVIGVVACQPAQMFYGDGYVSGEVFELNRDELKKEMEDAEAQFRAALHERVETLEWRSAMTYTSLAEYIACEARSADLLISSAQSGDFFDASRIVAAGELVLQAGRPVLFVPAVVQRPKLERVLIGWKDTREARRAVVDALPMLKTAAHVAVVEVTTEKDRRPAGLRLADVASWLKRHGISAETIVLPSVGDDADQLGTAAFEQDADLIVAGAYGHSRMREWVLGGVTRNLLRSTNLCALVSH